MIFHARALSRALIHASEAEPRVLARAHRCNLAIIGSGLSERSLDYLTLHREALFIICQC